jgi:RimJ/RimL family protein N-acetyltransferase
MSDKIDNFDNVTFRRMTAEEAGRFRTLRLFALQQHPRAYAQSFEEESQQPVQAFAQFLKGNIVLGAFDKDLLVGYTILSPVRQAKIAHKGTIWGAYVRPVYRNMQLAQRMRLRLFEIAKSMGMRYCQSSIMAGNTAALQVHKAVGYEECYREKDAVRHADGTFEDVIHLVKYL